MAFLLILGICLVFTVENSMPETKTYSQASPRYARQTSYEVNPQFDDLSYKFFSPQETYGSGNEITYKFMIPSANGGIGDDNTFSQVFEEMNRMLKDFVPPSADFSSGQSITYQFIPPQTNYASVEETPAPGPTYSTGFLSQYMVPTNSDVSHEAPSSETLYTPEKETTYDYTYKYIPPPTNNEPKEEMTYRFMSPPENSASQEETSTPSPLVPYQKGFLVKYIVPANAEQGAPSRTLGTNYAQQKEGTYYRYGPPPADSLSEEVTSTASPLVTYPASFLEKYTVTAPAIQIKTEAPAVLSRTNSVPEEETSTANQLVTLPAGFLDKYTVTTPAQGRSCNLPEHPSVEYRCEVRENFIVGSRPCKSEEPAGTVVRPECRAPIYYYPGVLNKMRCINGNWDHVAICSPECGLVTPEGEQLVIGGRLAKRGEFPWHAGIYRKTSTPYMQICGGSLVSNTVVISAAHCFWSDMEKQLPASNYAVAVGKIYRPWNNPMDLDVQQFNVSAIHIPKRFQGGPANFQEDIAVIILETPVVYRTYVRPVCVDFDMHFDRKQLQRGQTGKVAGWGLTEEDGTSSQILKVVDLPYVEIDECIMRSPPGFRAYITSDKICAGFGNGTALCKGDSGGGLVFPEWERSKERYYLRGVVSSAPTNDHACNAFTLTSFTQLTKHENFLKEYASFL